MIIAVTMTCGHVIQQNDENCGFMFTYKCDEHGERFPAASFDPPLRPLRTSQITGVEQTVRMPIPGTEFHRGVNLYLTEEFLSSLVAQYNENRPEMEKLWLRRLHRTDTYD